MCRPSGGPVLLVALQACVSGGGGGKGDGPGPTDGPPQTTPEPPSLSISAPAAFDPLRGTATITVQTDPGATVHLDVAGIASDGTADDAGAFSVDWDGTDGGAFVGA